MAVEVPEGGRGGRVQSLPDGDPLVSLRVAIDGFAATTTVSDVADALWRRGRHAVGATASGIALVDDSHRLLRFVPSAAHSLTPSARWSSAALVDDLPVAEATRTGTPLFFEEPPALLRRYPVLDPVQAATEDQSWAILPLIGPEAPDGVLTLAWDQPRTFSADDRDAIGSLSRLCAMALSRARLWQQRQQALLQLSHGLHPAELPAVRGAQIAASYRTADAAAVGGDFYDAFAVARSSRWRFVIGDVVGRGIDAAGLAGMARHCCRSVAADLGPARTLHRLHELLRGSDTAQLHLTALIADLTWDRGVARLRVARAGHPCALIVRADGSVEPVAGTGQAIGLFPGVQVDEVEVELERGETLVLHTDGITEARAGEDLFGDGRLATTLAGCVGLSAQETVDCIVDTVDAYRIGRSADDSAVVALRILPIGLGGVAQPSA